MNRLILNLEALQHNIGVVDRLMEQQGAKWTLVTKVLCGYPPALRALSKLGVRSIGDSRLENLKTIEPTMSGVETWYLRPPNLSEIQQVVALADVSLTTETRIIELLDKEAARQNKVHRIVIMIELGDLREGILPGNLIEFYEHVFKFPNIEVIGIGANLGCLSGTIPTVDQLVQLALYSELLELKFGRRLPFISAGTSAVLPMTLSGHTPKEINHYRVGETVFLGTDLINGGLLADLRDDVFTLESEVAEIKKKSLTPQGEINPGTSPFEMETEEKFAPGQRGYRALLSMGHLDTDVAGLTPVNPAYHIAGASSDITVLNVGEEKNSLSLGEKVEFKLSYSALLRSMSGTYVEKVLSPDLDAFSPAIDPLRQPRVDRLPD